PVARIANARPADPKRRKTAEIFHTWSKHHGGNKIVSSDLHYDVKVLLVPNTKEPSRQAVQSPVSTLVGTRLAGVHVCADQDDRKKGEKGWWTPALYWLERTDKIEQAADVPPADKGSPDEAAPQDAQLESEADGADDCQLNHEPDDAAVRPDAGGIAF